MNENNPANKLSGEREKLRALIKQAISELDLKRLIENAVKVELAKLRGKVE